MGRLESSDRLDHLAPAARISDNRSMEQTWQTDILGKPFKKLTMDLGKDDEGPLSATLVRSLP